MRIPATFCWAVSTFTTIGYGDIVPITSLGKIFASVFAVIGMGMFALPAGILASAFSATVRSDHSKHNKSKDFPKHSPDMNASPSLHFCPHCGTHLSTNTKHEDIS